MILTDDCARCKREMPANNLIVDLCFACTRAVNPEYRKTSPEIKLERLRLRELRAIKECAKLRKKCPLCLKTKNKSEFYDNKQSIDGKDFRCRLCVNQKRKHKYLIHKT